MKAVLRLIVLIILVESVNGGLLLLFENENTNYTRIYNNSRNNTSNSTAVGKNSYNKTGTRYVFGDGLTITERYICIALFSIVMIVGVIGNSLVIYIYRYRKSKSFSKFEILIFSLGIVDLIASVMNPLLYIYQMAYKYQRWHFGNIGCKLLSGIGPISTSISLGIILILAIDRDRAVVTPFKIQFTEVTICKGIAVTVILAVTVISPYMYFLHLKQNICTINKEHYTVFSQYTFSLYLASDVLFLLILSFTTIRIVYKMTATDVVSYPRELRIQETRRMLKIIIVMGIAFIVLIFPRDILRMIRVYSYLHQPSSPIRIPRQLFVNAILKLVHTSNSCVNVFLYSAVHKRFRRDMLRLLMQPICLRKAIRYDETLHFCNQSESPYLVRRQLLAGNGPLSSSPILTARLKPLAD